MWPRFHRRDLTAPGLALHAGYSTKTSDHHWPAPGRDLGMHGFLLLAAGAGRYQDAAGTRQAVAGGDAWIIFPGLRHDYGPGPGQRWEECFLDVRGGLLPLLEQQGLIDRARPVWRPEPADAAPLRRLIDDLVAGTLADAQEAQWRLHGAVLALARGRAGQAGDGAIAAARRVLEETPPERPLDLRRVAAGVGLEWEAFRKRFRRQLGHGPREHRLAVRCRRAAELLLRPGTDAAAVAAATGFCDPSHLGRHFRAVHGMTPAAFRRLHGSG